MLIEVCVDTLAGMAEAVAGGADRIELCSALALGGLTPSVGLMQAARGCGVPVYAMIRPRAGGFVYDSAELAVMQTDIAAARAAGLAGVVFGANLPDGRLDAAVLRDLCDAAAGMGRSLHRAFDLVPDLQEALELAISLGFERILTSGQALRAEYGVAVLTRLVDLAQGRISIMPGSGISAQTVAALRHIALLEVHGSCAEAMETTGKIAEFGFAGPELRQTRAALVRALRTALAD